MPLTTTAPNIKESRGTRSSGSITVIMLASRPGSLRRTLMSLLRAEAPAPSEVLLVLNGKDAACAQVAEDFKGRIPGLKVVADAPRSLGGARNAAARQAHGDWLCFLDDDVTVPPRYFRVLDEKIGRYPGAAVIGGPNPTPPKSPRFQRCVGHVLGSWLGAWRMRRRLTGFGKDSWTDDQGFILCNLVLNREVLFSTDLGFDEELVRNEENHLIARLLERGHTALHAPGLFVFHERRSNLGSFARQCFLSGQGRAQMSLKIPGSLRVVYFLPLALASGCLLAPFFPALLIPCLAAYAVMVAANAVYLALTHAEGVRSLAWLAILVPTAHVSYAVGMATGFSMMTMRRSRLPHSARLGAVPR